MKTSWLTRVATIVVASTAATASMAHAQTRLSAGAGLGIAGSTSESLSNGHAAPVLMAQATVPVAPLLSLGGQLDYWRRRVANATFVTGVVRLRVPATSFTVQAGFGFGTGNPGTSTRSGAAGQIGATYDMVVPGSPIGLTLFGDGYVVHGSAGGIQMIAGGLAITWR